MIKSTVFLISLISFSGLHIVVTSEGIEQEFPLR